MSALAAIVLRRAFDIANRTGDLTFAGYSCNNLITNLLAAGDPLSEVQREAEPVSISRGRRSSGWSSTSSPRSFS